MKRNQQLKSVNQSSKQRLSDVNQAKDKNLDLFESSGSRIKFPKVQENLKIIEKERAKINQTSGSLVAASEGKIASNSQARGLIHDKDGSQNNSHQIEGQSTTQKSDKSSKATTGKQPKSNHSQMDGPSFHSVMNGSERAQSTKLPPVVYDPAKQAVNNFESPLLDKQKRIEAINYGFSFNSKKMAQGPAFFNLRIMCDCLGKAIMRHIDYSEGELWFLDQKKEMKKQRHRLEKDP